MCDMGGGRVGGLISVWDVCCVEVEMVRESQVSLRLQLHEKSQHDNSHSWPLCACTALYLYVPNIPIKNGRNYRSLLNTQTVLYTLSTCSCLHGWL